MVVLVIAKNSNKNIDGFPSDVINWKMNAHMIQWLFYDYSIALRIGTEWCIQ